MLAKSRQTEKNTEKKGLDMKPNKTLIEKKKMRLISLYIDTETEEMLEILKHKKRQFGSVIIRDAIREYYARFVRSGLYVPDTDEQG